MTGTFINVGAILVGTAIGVSLCGRMPESLQRRVMAGLGLALRRGGKLYQHRGFQRLVLLMGPSGLIALLAGWVTTEVGRQPWVVYGLLRTHDAASHHSVAQMSTSLALFVVIYFTVFSVGIGYMMKLVKKGPQPHHEHPPEGDPTQTPRRPLSAAPATSVH